MFKSARWRSEKNRIKAEFKLQFLATQVSQLGVDGLTMSVVPGDVGKPTARLEKVKVEGGSCRWENPVYETVKFIQDVKTGKINEKIYYFIISKGWTKAGVLGEVSLNFADYAEARKPSSVSLPLDSNSDAVLHVSIQRLQENVNQSREIKDGDDIEAIAQEDLPEDYVESKATKDEPLNSPSLNGKCTGSSGSDITLSGSESSSGSLDSNTFPPPSLTHSSLAHKPAPYEENHHRSQWEWSLGFDQGASTDDSADDIIPRAKSPQEVSDDEIQYLKLELVVLGRRAEVSELELQTLRKQIVKESKKWHDLSREILSLKEERNFLRTECEKLKAVQCMDAIRFKRNLHLEGRDLVALLEELRQELNYERDLNSNLRIQLEKTQESNTELILAVRDLEEMVEQQKDEVRDPTILKCKAEDDEGQKALEALVKERHDQNDTYVLEQKVIDLYGEIEMYRRDKDELETQMEQVALDYEILKQQNHDISYKLEQSQLQDQLDLQHECTFPSVKVNELETQIESLETELMKQSKDLSDSLNTAKELEAYIKKLEGEIKKRAEEFEADLEEVTLAKIEQEKRAIRAEECLRQMRLKTANTAEKIQHEFRRLSLQMASTFDANEKVAVNAMAEANELTLQKSRLEEMVQKSNKEIQSLRDVYESKLCDLLSQVDMKTSQVEEMLSELDKKSHKLENVINHEEEACRSLHEEMERLKTENNSLYKQSEEFEIVRLEMEEMQKSVKENEMIIESMKKEAKKTWEEINRIKHLKTEKEIEVEVLQSELKMLKDQCDEFKHSLFEDETEKEKLRKQIFQLKGEVKKREEAFNNVEKKLKLSNGRTVSASNKCNPTSPGIKEVTNLREKIKLLEGQIKWKEIALETSASSFLEKEKDLQIKIEELESRLEEINHISKFQEEKDYVEDVPTGSIEDGYSSDQLLTDLSSLKEMNISMESELKEIQERYSEISLKFAEVEGERQQLVMTLRNLKNSKKS